jgi:hypothetical protein
MKKTAPILFLIILFAAAAWFFFTSKPDPVHELPSSISLSSLATEEQLTGPRSGDIEAVSEPLSSPIPLLNESDTEVTRALAEIAGAEPLAKYLVKNQVISRLVATIDSLTGRQVSAQINPIKPVDKNFRVETEGESFVMGEKNFARYDGYIGFMQTVPAGALVKVYQHYYPLFQQAWEEIGGKGPFNERLVEIIDHLLQTPDVPGRVYLTRPEAVYLFEDPELEALTAGQKILVRMGAVNAALVKQKLIETRSEVSVLQF